jgi:hypothetical protein
MLLRKIFVPKGEEVRGEWRKLHNEGLRDLHSSLSIIRKGKVTPLQARCGPEGGQRYNSTLP